MIKVALVYNDDLKHQMKVVSRVGPHMSSEEFLQILGDNNIHLADRQNKTFAAEAGIPIAELNDYHTVVGFNGLWCGITNGNEFHTEIFR